MKQIRKYPVALADYQYVPMPRGARPLHVAVQREPASQDPFAEFAETVKLWAVVDDAEPEVYRRLLALIDGQPDSQGCTGLPYLGSAILPPRFVIHYFDGGEEAKEPDIGPAGGYPEEKEDWR